MQIVNGYACQNCTDVDLAKKNIDPAHPKLANGRPATPDQRKADRDAELGVNRPSADGTVGTKVNVFV